MPDIVNADENGQYVGMMIPAVRLDARVNINNAVAADAEVGKGEHIRILCGKGRCTDHGITLSDVQKTAAFGIAAGIGDGITLKENFHVGVPPLIFIFKLAEVCDSKVRSDHTHTRIFGQPVRIPRKWHTHNAGWHRVQTDPLRNT